MNKSRGHLASDPVNLRLPNIFHCLSRTSTVPRFYKRSDCLHRTPFFFWRLGNLCFVSREQGQEDSTVHVYSYLGDMLTFGVPFHKFLISSPLCCFSKSQRTLIHPLHPTHSYHTCGDFSFVHHICQRSLSLFTTSKSTKAKAVSIPKPKVLDPDGSCVGMVLAPGVCESDEDGGGESAGRVCVSNESRSGGGWGGMGIAGAVCPKRTSRRFNPPRE